MRSDKARRSGTLLHSFYSYRHKSLASSLLFGSVLYTRLEHQRTIFGYMPRGPNVATSLFIVSNAKLDLSYFCMWACCPVLKSLVRLSGQLESA